MKKSIRLWACLLVVMLLVNCLGVENVRAESISISEQEKNRYIALVLEVSDNMKFYSNNEWFYTADSAVKYVKDAAHRFVENIESAYGNNQVAIIIYDSSANLVNGFTADYKQLDDNIENIETGDSSRNLQSALSLAQELFEEVSGENISKDIILFTTGMVNDGDLSYEGFYDSSTVGNTWERRDTGEKLYAYANIAHAKAQELKNEGVSIFTIGLFQTMGNMPAQGEEVVQFFKLCTKNLASNPEQYYEVENVDNLIFTFGEVADALIQNEMISRYISQHMAYFTSDKYENEIARGYGSFLNDILEEQRNDMVVLGYNILDDINTLMKLDFSSTAEVSVYSDRLEHSARSL